MEISTFTATFNQEKHTAGVVHAGYIDKLVIGAEFRIKDQRDWYLLVLQIDKDLTGSADIELTGHNFHCRHAGVLYEANPAQKVSIYFDKEDEFYAGYFKNVKLTSKTGKSLDLKGAFSFVGVVKGTVIQAMLDNEK